MIKSLFRQRRKGTMPEKAAEKSTGPSEDGSSSSTACKVDSMQEELNELRRQLKASEDQIEEKEKHIETLEKQMESKNDMLNRNQGLEDKLASYLLGRAAPSQALTLTPSQPTKSEIEPEEPEVKSRRFSLTHSIRKQFSNGLESRESVALPEKVMHMERWLIDHGNKALDIESLLTEYAERCLGLGIPLDRLMVVYPSRNSHFPSYSFKWEFGKQFREREDPPGAARKYEEPFVLLFEGREMEYRMSGGLEDTPRGCKWFTMDQFQDYFALPVYQAGKIVGAIAWSTKASGGFSGSQIEVFKKSLSVLASFTGCFVKELVIASLLNTIEVEIQEQTTELAAANTSLAKANKRIVQQAEIQLRNFAMMSHEIRTPLNCIVGMSNLLLHSDLDENVKESVEMITGSGDLLLAVVDDVLDYSKLATGKVETRIQTTQIAQIIRAVVTSVDIRAQTTGVELQTKLAANLPTGIETDGRRLQQILYNLLGNAIKFGREGKCVEFEVDLVDRTSPKAIDGESSQLPEMPSDNLIRFTIKDYGKGIQSSEIDKIFHPFQQAATNDPTHGGTGLGLAITKQLVRVLGGKISVESEYGSWCKFTVLLPLEPERLIVDELQAEVPVPMLRQLSRQLSRTLSISSSNLRDVSNRDMTEDDGFSWSDDDSYSSLSASTPTNSMSQSTLSTRFRQHVNLPKVPSFFSGDKDIIIHKDRDSQSSSTQNHGTKNHTFPQQSEFEADQHSEAIPTFSVDDARQLLEQHRKSPPATSEPEQPHRVLLALTDQDIKENSGDLDFASLKVLIAEDNKINQKVLNRTLTRIGFQDIDIVDDGKQAVEAYEANEYDVIFMDLQMPVMDGLEATSVISSKKKEKDAEYPKIAFLTAHALVDYQDKAAAVGGDGFVSKPYKLEILRELVIRFMEKRSQR